MKKRLISGIQPTGQLHLGNYLGSIRNWIPLAEEHETLVFLADLHAITIAQEPSLLRSSIRNTAATYIACGLDPKAITIFCQSAVYQHTELAWILSCMTQIGWMNRMTQFKEKSAKVKDLASFGLYAYPILMASDILVYKADIVPVGADQKQHIELTRDIASAFNRHVGIEYFKLPEPKIFDVACRIMSLRDGTKKMSKSDESDYSRINLNDDADLILKKIQKAKSDSIIEITYNKEARPEVSNLIEIYSALSNQKITEIVNEYHDAGFAKFKRDLAEILITHISPITRKINELKQEPDYLDQVLKEGANKARTLANIHMQEIKELIGFLPS